MDPDRLEELDRRLERLTAEIAEARRELQAVRRESTAPSPPAARDVPPRETPPAAAPALARTPVRPADRPAPSAADEGLERLVGRYGAPALAALTILMGTGALVSWAVRRGLIGPWMRVGLGLLLACGLAAVGYRVRARGQRVFGNVLLGLGLAALHVVAWGAGPYLHLVPGWVALLVADTGSLALATFAVAEADELPFALAFGGALIAPFVLSSNSGAYLVLATYGVLVVAGGVGVIRDFEWTWSRRIAVVATAVYVYALRDNAMSPAWLGRELPALFALVLATAAASLGSAPVGPRLATGALGAMAVFGAASPPWAIRDAADLLAMAPDIPLVALAGSVTALVVGRELAVSGSRLVSVLAAMLIPVLLLLQVLVAMRAPSGDVLAAGLMLPWCVAYGLAARSATAWRRGALLSLSATIAMLAAAFATDKPPTFLPPAVAGVAVLYAWIAGRDRQPMVSIPCGLAVLIAYVLALFAMSDATAPFTTFASLGAGSAVAAAWLVVHWLPLDEPIEVAGRNWTRDQLKSIVTIALAFIWVRLELSRISNADVSLFLLLAYDAAAGVLALAAGRKTREPSLRHIGLALALFAAVRAVGIAWNVQQIGLRVGSYLLVGAFLLLVARWYWERPGPGDRGVSAT